MQGDTNQRIATIIWAALAGGVLLFLGVYLLLPPPARFVEPDPGFANIVLVVATGVSAVTVAVSWLWAIRLRLPVPGAGDGAGSPSPGELGRARLIVAAALCEGSALLALVFLLLTRDGRLVFPLALSVGALLAHFPGERHWARLCGTGDTPRSRGG